MSISVSYLRIVCNKITINYLLLSYKRNSVKELEQDFRRKYMTKGSIPVQEGGTSFFCAADNAERLEKRRKMEEEKYNM